MREWMAITAALVLAGCGAAEAPVEPKEDPPILLKAGQWEFTRTMTGYNTPTVTAEEYAAKVGKKSEAALCLAVAPDGRPDPDALAGKDGKDCTYKDSSIRKGRFIATLSCKAGSGTSELVLEGNYTPDSLTLGSSMTRMEGGAAALRTTVDLTGKRIGDCDPAKPS